ncbi:MAG: hypothetical protein G3W58_22810 [Pantoea ananatis]|nr:hypothetical protein [Pantoea ananatis]
MPDLLYHDHETRSRLDLKRVGSFRYAEDCEIILTCAALNDDKPTIVSDLEGQPRPKWLIEALDEAEHGTEIIIVGANWAHFDREVILHQEGRDIPMRNVHDLMFLAYRHGMPGSLDMLCEAMGVPEEFAKSFSDYRFSKPLPPKKAKELGSEFLLPEHDPVNWEEFRDNYSWRDIAAMQWIYPRLPTWSNTDMEDLILEIDMAGQRRGLLIDKELAAAADRANKVMVAKLKADAIAKYGANPASPKAWMEIVRNKASGFHIPNGQKGTVAELVADPDFPEEAAEMLRIYGIAMGKAASKYAVMLNAACNDGRVRGTTVYGGAYRSLRDAGRLLQTQNLASRGIYGGTILDAGIVALKKDTYKGTFNLPKLLASAVRPCIQAAPGNKLIVADFSQIEARFLAWLAGEKVPLKTFEAYDASPLDAHGERTGDDIYKITAAGMFGVPVSEVTKFMRSVGKVSVLALGYAGGVGAYISMAKNYGIDLDKLAETVTPQLPEWAVNKALSSWEWHKIHKISRHGLNKETWVAINALVKMWRKANSKIEQLWHDCEDAAIQAMRNPGMVFSAGAKVRADGSRALKFWRTTTESGKPGRYLCIELPSGRIMNYRDPKLKEEIDDEGRTKGVTLYYKGKADGKAIAIAKAKKKPLTDRQKKWTDISTFGGKLVENVTQAGSRDRLMHTLPVTARAGYLASLKVHDEVVAEVPDSPDYTCAEMCELMGLSVGWDKGLPVSAAGFETYHYRK